MPKILVVGSINMDIVNHVQKHPLPGETIKALSTEYIPGGKGANQAVASSLSGADVTFIGALGTDPFASQLNDSLQRFGVKTDRIMKANSSSGIAFITVDQCGENSIILYDGSNAKLSVDYIRTMLSIIVDVDAVLLQNEIPWGTTEFVIKEASKLGTKVFFNPAPALNIPDELLSLIDVMILNEIEAQTVTGINVDGTEQMENAVQWLINRGVREVFLTMGEQGAFYQSHLRKLRIPAYEVNAVDTTAAGDTFIGAFSTAICSNSSIEESLRYASAAAAICVTRKGAQLSIPTSKDVHFFLNKCGMESYD